MAKTPREQLADTVKYATEQGNKQMAESALRRLQKLDDKDQKKR